MKNGLIVDKDGNKYWYKDDLLHREDGPAVEWANGSKQWFTNGKWHRIDGPAIEWINGDKEWRINGKRHRIDGPAREYADGNKFWFYQDQQIDCESQEEFDRIVKLLCFL